MQRDFKRGDIPDVNFHRKIWTILHGFSSTQDETSEVDMCFSATWAAKEGWISTELRDRIHSQFRRAGLSLDHECFTKDKLLYGTTAIMQRRDGDLYAAIPDGEIGKCRFIMLSDFGSREEMDASLESALEFHKELMSTQGGGEGKECNITEGYHRNNTKVSKLELGTWAERLEEVVSEMGDAQSFVTLKKKAAQITQWWDLSAKFMEQCSTPLAEPVLKILKATALENPSAWGGSSAFRKRCSVGFRKARHEFCIFLHAILKI